MGIFGYLYTNSQYNIDVYKWIVSVLLFSFFGVGILTQKDYNEVYSYLIRFIYAICLIPMLSVYAFFDGIDFVNILYPLVFMLLLIFLLRKISSQKVVEEKQIFKMPRILYINHLLLGICAILAVGIWVINGSPIILDLSYAREQRMQLRANAMPTIMAYVFAFLGSTVFPYLFAKYIDEKKYVFSLISFACGILLFFVNGMKTWLFLYVFFFFIIIVLKLGNGKIYRTCYLIDLAMLLLIMIAVFAFNRLHSFGMLSKLGRVLVAPNNIGFSFVDFFKQAEHPLLFLRESVLRYFFATPYAGGSDFFVNHGANASLTASRANNGLWGDAYRNFGMVGIIVYPLLIAKIFNIVESNSRHMKPTLRIFTLFMVLWGAINNSFFTWLLTGGVFVIIVLEKLDRSNMDYDNEMQLGT